MMAMTKKNDIFVGNLSFETTEEQLQQVFSTVCESFKEIIFRFVTYYLKPYI